MSRPDDHRVGDADGRNLGRGGDALDHRGADDERAAPAPAARSGRSAPICRAAGALHAATGLRRGSATRPRRTARSPARSAGSRPPVNSAAIDTPVTEPMVISTRLGGMVSVMRAGRRRAARPGRPRLRAALLHLGEQHRRHRRHVGGLRAGDAGHQVHRAEQHVVQPAADMAEQAGEERRPSPAPCRSSRSAGRGRRTAAPPAG